MRIVCSITLLYSSTFYSLFLPFFVLEIFKFKYDKVFVRYSASISKFKWFEQPCNNLKGWKVSKILRKKDSRPRACLPARLILTGKFSAWVYWKLCCHFWPIKPRNFAHVVLPTLFFPVNSTWLSLEWICQRFFIKP